MNVRTMLIAFSLTLTALGQTASAQDGPVELAYCVAIANFPASDRQRGGFDIEIAEILAEQLGATATFTWTNFDEIGIRDTLHSGLCDVAVGVTEGISGIMTTVPYLNAPYAFVTLTDAGPEIESLDDPQLAEVRIGTYQAGLPSIALRNRGIVDNVTEYAAIVRPTGVDSNTPILDALDAGEIDVAIVFGPAAAARAMESERPLTVTAVTPEVDVGPRLLQLTRILTLGVRQHDEALRDALNRALANRWEDVMAVLDAYGIPQLQVPRPVDTAELANAWKVGVIVPASTPASLANAPVGDEALRGALVAENAVSTASGEEPVLVLTAHAPTLESVRRAALRLVHVDGVDALVGGFDQEEARAIAEISAANGVAFFNVGSSDDALRDAACHPTTFNVAPSTAMMVDATVTGAVGGGDDAMFVVVESGTVAEGLVAGLETIVANAGGRLVGSASVEQGQFVFYPLIQELEELGEVTVLLLMSSASQEVLYSQAASFDLSARFLGISPIDGQSRPYLQRFLQVAPTFAAEPRVVAWDPAIDSELNSTFASRTGEPMEPIAWSTYAGIRVSASAARAGVLDDGAALRDFLVAPPTSLEVGKDGSVSFRSADGQMQQDLYLIAVTPDAQWGRTASARTALAHVVEVIPAEVTADSIVEPVAACEAP